MLAEFSTTSFEPDQLLTGGVPLASQKAALLEGQALLRGAVLGRITLGEVSSALKAGGNTGGGALTLDPTTPILDGAKVGIYTVRCTIAAGAGGTFEITDPEGTALGTVAVGATFASGIKFTIADGTPDFSVGDGFDITITAGSGKAVLSLAAALDGSQAPDAILAEDCDASGGDKEALVYTRGDFNTNALTLGTGHTVGSIEEVLRDKGIFLTKALAA